MVKPEHVAEGVISFATDEIFPALEGWKLLAAPAALILFLNNQLAKIDVYAKDKKIAMLGVIDKDGMIDVDKAIDALKQAMRMFAKRGIKIEMFDIEFNFTEQNAETLRGYIERAAGINSVE